MGDACLWPLRLDQRTASAVNWRGSEVRGTVAVGGSRFSLPVPARLGSPRLPLGLIFGERTQHVVVLLTLTEMVLRHRERECSRGRGARGSTRAVLVPLATVWDSV